MLEKLVHVLPLPSRHPRRDEPRTEGPLPVRPLPVRADRGKLLVVWQPHRATRLFEQPGDRPACGRRDHAPVPLEDARERAAVRQHDREPGEAAAAGEVSVAAAAARRAARGAGRATGRSTGAVLDYFLEPQPARRRPRAGCPGRPGPAPPVECRDFRTDDNKEYHYYQPIRFRQDCVHLPRISRASGRDGRRRAAAAGRGRPDGGGQGGDARRRDPQGDQLEPGHPAGHRDHHGLSGDARGLRDRPLCDRQAARASPRGERRGPPRQRRGPGRDPYGR